MKTWVGDYESNDHAEVREKVFGFDAYKPGQEEIIDATLGGENVFATGATGSGKSLGFQLPAAMDSEGATTLVVSPLLALMRDQVAFLQSKKVPAIDLHSGKNEDDRKIIMEGIRDRVYALVLLSPEQLQSRDFGETSRNAKFSRVVVDEAHCIARWGHDFRPEYLKIGDFIKQRDISQILAFTATASPRTKGEIRDRLNLKNPFEYHGEIERPNLLYTVEKIDDPKQRRQIIERKIKELAPGEKDAVIIYCSTRDDTENVAAHLKRKGLQAEHYHAGLEDYERKDREQKFLNDECKVFVTTTAFSMGVDKSNVRLVIHHRMPGGVEEYLQETGRAGRDGDPAHCVLIYHENDRNVHDHFIFEKSPTVQSVKVVYDAIARQYAASRQKVGTWFPLNRIGLYKTFVTTSEGKQRQRDSYVNASIDFMVEQGIIENKAGYVMLKPFPATESAIADMQAQTNDRKGVAKATLEQIVQYATAASPDQKMLVELLNQS